MILELQQYILINQYLFLININLILTPIFVMKLIFLSLLKIILVIQDDRSIHFQIDLSTN